MSATNALAQASCQWESTIWESWSATAVDTRHHDRFPYDGTNSANVGCCKLTHLVCLINEGIAETMVWVSPFARRAFIANDGMQSHGGTHAFNAMRSSKHDVTLGHFSTLRRIYTATCARLLGGETCCTSRVSSQGFRNLEWRVIAFGGIATTSTTSESLQDGKSEFYSWRNEWTHP